jgi:hypothetical protein
VITYYIYKYIYIYLINQFYTNSILFYTILGYQSYCSVHMCTIDTH